MKKILTLLVILIFNISCEQPAAEAPSSEVTKTTPKTTVQEISLNLNEKIEVLKGDTYKSRSQDAKVNIEHNTSTDKKYITLVSGQGVILR